ncbi:MAG: EAL domain-containing protein [Aquihabitans sp.]
MAAQPNPSQTTSGIAEALSLDPRNSLIEHVSEVVSVINAQGIVTYISPSVTTHLGWQPEQVIGRPISDFLDLSRHPNFADDIGAVSAVPGTHGPFGLNLLTVDGSIRLMQTLVTNRLTDPEVLGLVTVARDETDRVAEEEVRLRAEARFRALVQFSSDVVVVVDPRGMVTYASPSVERILGVANTGDDFNVFDLVHPDDVSLARHNLGLAVADPERMQGSPTELRIRTGDGEWRLLEVLGQNLVNDPDVGGIVFNGRDVTDRRWAEDLVTEQADVLEGIARGLPIDSTLNRVVAMIERRVPGAVASVASLRDDGWMVHPWAPNFPPDLTRRFDDHPADSSLARALRQIEPMLFADVATDPRWDDLSEAVTAAGFRSCWCFPMLVPGGDHQVGMITVLHPDARLPRPGEVELLERARNLAAIAVERRRFEGELEHQAMHDVLTGLPNRLLLMDRVDQALARTQRHGVDVAVLFIDLDNFKLINDSLGHSVGDRLLEAVADRFKGAVRPDDTVGRFGGDEFVVVCEEVGGEVGAIMVAEHLAKALEEPVLVGGAEVHVSASIGITLARDGSIDPHSLIRDADAAMYRAKDQGRAGHAVFETALHERVVHRLGLERALRAALVDAELVVHYQPVIRLADSAVVGFEALVRWDRPGSGLVEPESFIAVAEETGLIVPLDRWVMYEACRQLALWRADGLADRMRVSVNLSARQLGDPELISVVAGALGAAELDGSALVIEITESALAADAQAALTSLRALHDMGVGLAIDDFGTGYASLDYLRRFAMADQLKIDRSFVADLDSGAPRDQAIVSASLVLARDLGFISVAEGVETEGQRAVLLALGCTLAQGYLFCPPLPADELEQWLRAATAAAPNPR